MRNVKVWDLPVRVFHWVASSIVLLNITLFDEGKIHETLGYMLLVQLSIRTLWGFAGSHYARFSTFFPTRSRLKAHLAYMKAQGCNNGPENLGHNPLGALMIFNLMGTLAAVGLTGHLMTTDTFWGSDVMEHLHEGFVVWLLASVGMHVAGVLTESIRTRVNLIGAMVSGIKRVR